MKNTFRIKFTFIILSLFAACQSPIESTNLPDSIKTWFQHSLDDPNSFEYVGSEEVNVNDISSFFGDFEVALKYINADYLQDGANTLVKYRANNPSGNKELKYILFITEGNSILQATEVNPAHLNKK